MDIFWMRGLGRVGIPKLSTLLCFIVLNVIYFFYFNVLLIY